MLLAEHDDVAAIIALSRCNELSQPATWIPSGIARSLRQTQSFLLIFDEIVTGFRLAYGGAQETLWRDA